MLKKIILKNFKAFKSLEIEIKPITILVGPNSGGKTSILNSIGLMKQTLGSDTSDVLNFKDAVDFGSFESVVNQNFDDEEIRFRIEFEDNTYFDIKIAKCRRSDEIYIAHFSSNNGRFEYIVDNIKKVISKTENEIYIADDFKFTSLDPGLNNNLFEGINLLLYRKKFFYNIGNFIDDKSKESLFSEICDHYYTTDNSPKLGIEEVRYYFNKILNLYSEVNMYSFDFYEKVKSEFENIKIIGPVRPIASRYYDLKHKCEINYKGEYTVQTIASDSVLQDKISEIFKDLELANNFEISTDINTNTFMLKLLTHTAKSGVNFADVGCGTSQILPIIAQSFLADKNTLIAIEQPEVHLHPKVQAELGSLFVNYVKNGKGKYLIETHSDYLIERIRYCVADKKISSEDVLIYYIEQDESQGTSTASKIEINSLGQYLGLPESYYIHFKLNETRNMTKRISKNLSEK